MRRRAIISFAAACVLSACATQNAPNLMGGMAWTFDENPSDGAKLAFGAPNSDNVVIMMTCEPRSGEVQVWLSGDETHRVELRSGRQVAQLSPQPSGEGFSGMQAKARAADPVLANFSRTGQLSIALAGRTTPLPAAAEGRRFVESCRKT